MLYALLLLFLAYSVYKSATNWEFFKFAFRKFIDALPSLMMLVIVIGGIVAGYFTATEASAVAVLYALILAVLLGARLWHRRRAGARTGTAAR